MRILRDQNLSPKLIPKLSGILPGLETFTIPNSRPYPACGPDVGRNLRRTQPHRVDRKSVQNFHIFCRLVFNTLAPPFRSVWGALGGKFKSRGRSAPQSKQSDDQKTMQPSKEIQTSGAIQISRQNNRQRCVRTSPKMPNISRFAPIIFIDGKYSPFSPARQPANHAAKTPLLAQRTRSPTLRHIFASASQKSPSLRPGASSQRSLDIQVKPTYPDAKDHLNAK